MVQKKTCRLYLMAFDLGKYRYLISHCDVFSAKMNILSLTKNLTHSRLLTMRVTIELPIVIIVKYN